MFCPMLWQRCERFKLSELVHVDRLRDVGSPQGRGIANNPPTLVKSLGAGLDDIE